MVLIYIARLSKALYSVDIHPCMHTFRATSSGAIRVTRRALPPELMPPQNIWILHIQLNNSWF